MAGTLNPDQVCEVLGYFTGARGADPQPNREYLYDLVRRGDFPRPINPRLPSRMWRWGEALVERVVAGEWNAGGSSLPPDVPTAAQPPRAGRASGGRVHPSPAPADIAGDAA